MISNYVAGLYPSGLLPVALDAADHDLPGFQARFQAVMADAISEYGPRDERWNLLGLEIFPENANPAVRTSISGGKNCVLCISKDVNEAEWLMDWQLAHEAVHLLSPPLLSDATIFEEGVASYNQHRVTAKWHSRYYEGFKIHQQAFDIVRPLVESHADGVRNLRAANDLRLSPVTAELIIDHFPSVKASDAKILARRFYV